MWLTVEETSMRSNALESGGIPMPTRIPITAKTSIISETVNPVRMRINRGLTIPRWHLFCAPRCSNTQAQTRSLT